MGWFTTFTSLLQRNCNNKDPFPYFLSFFIKINKQHSPKLVSPNYQVVSDWVEKLHNLAINPTPHADTDSRDLEIQKKTRVRHPHARTPPHPEYELPGPSAWHDLIESDASQAFTS